MQKKSVLILLFHSLIACCTSSPSDQEALLALKSSISENNIISKNWSSSAPVCTWIGISCGSMHERVTSLNISNMNLEGRIPPELGNLSFLSSLNLSHNKFYGSLPQELANLRRLKSIDLKSNHFSGSLPSIFFSSMPNLRSLHLSNNSLSGHIPTSIGNASELDYLALEGNSLEGEIPKEIGNLRYLTSLISGYNRLEGSIPREIGNLTGLTILHLQSNNLEGEIPAEIGNLQKLKVLELSENKLSGSIPPSIFNISQLLVFGSWENDLSGNFPHNFGQGMPNLQNLYLGFNNLGGSIPDSISNASKLTYLDLSTNSFTGFIPESLGNLEFLEILGLASNKFTSLSSTSELTFLTSLTKCRRLQHLDILLNPLGGKLPTSVGNFSRSLERITAKGCKIQGKIPEEIGNLSSLGRLVLSNNELTGTIPKTVIGLEKLQELYLGNNEIMSLIPHEICRLEKLGRLFLSQNQIYGALPSCMGNMTSLRYLYLAFNRLSFSLPASIWSLNDILEFDASSNMFNGPLPPELGNLKVAYRIILSMNNFSGEIPTTVGDLERLTHLSLAHNRLEGPIPESLSKVLSLESLDLSYNRLTGEIPMSLKSLSSLRYLNVSFNKLTGEIPNDGPFVNFTDQSFMFNEALCGASRFNVPTCHPDKKRVFRIALYAILGFASLTITLVGLVLIIIRCKRKKQDANETDPSLTNQVSHERISYYELQKATDGFNESNMLGMGGFSSVYKGTLKDGTVVAVKVFNMQLKDAFRSFDRECEVLRSIRHRNLTKVISSCTNPDFRALVLEYMPNESLEKWLYSHNYFLDIQQRLDIVIDVACALDYLHNCYPVPVVHCDLKPSNVLLDMELVGHVSDFGISKILDAGENISQTKTLATFGYIAPEYGREGLVSTRSDVYSYGILLMETFTRKKPSDDMFAAELSLKDWVKDSLLITDSIARIADSNLLTQEEGNFDAKVQCLLSVLKLALECTEELPDLRISMKDVVTALNKIKHQFITS